MYNVSLKVRRRPSCSIKSQNSAHCGHTMHTSTWTNVWDFHCVFSRRPHCVWEGNPNIRGIAEVLRRRTPMFALSPETASCSAQILGVVTAALQCKVDSVSRRQCQVNRADDRVTVRRTIWGGTSVPKQEKRTNMYR